MKNMLTTKWSSSLNTAKRLMFNYSKMTPILINLDRYFSVNMLNIFIPSFINLKQIIFSKTLSEWLLKAIQPVIFKSSLDKYATKLLSIFARWMVFYNRNKLK